jgi:hypothetical protein
VSTPAAEQALEASQPGAPQAEHPPVCRSPALLLEGLASRVVAQKGKEVFVSPEMPASATAAMFPGTQAVGYPSFDSAGRSVPSTPPPRVQSMRALCISCA